MPRPDPSLIGQPPRPAWPSGSHVLWASPRCGQAADRAWALANACARCASSAPRRPVRALSTLIPLKCYDDCSVFRDAYRKVPKHRYASERFVVLMDLRHESSCLNAENRVRLVRACFASRANKCAAVRDAIERLEIENECGLRRRRKGIVVEKSFRFLLARAQRDQRFLDLSS